jgi:hypothetical protein
MKPLAFLSYARADMDLVVVLSNELRAAGISLWVDRLDIASGEEWDVAIDKALRRSSHVIVLLSPRSVASRNVLDEVNFSLENGKAIIPVLLAECERPFRLRRLQYIDCASDFNAGAQILKDVLLAARDTIGSSIEPLNGSEPSATRPAQVNCPLPTLAVEKGGCFVGGSDAVRRAALALLDPTWNGDVSVNCEAIEVLEAELRELESLSACTPEQGDRIVSLRGSLGYGRLTITRVVTALRSTFMLAPFRERTWGANMALDDATIFIESLFAHARLAAIGYVDWTKCWVYLPAFNKHRLMTPVFLPDTSKREASDRWRAELNCFPRLSRWSDWSDVLPVLAFHNQPIARYVLPAVVFELVQSVPFEEGNSVAAFWKRLAEVHPPEGDRDPLNPFDWCVALNPDLNKDDLKWKLSTPPRSIADLQSCASEMENGRRT